MLRTTTRKGASSNGLWAIGLALASSLTLFSCYPGDAENVTELDLVLTQYDKDTDFSDYKTYSMPDSVIDIAKLIDPDNEDEFDHAYDNAILERIMMNMTDRGFTYIHPDSVNSGNEPDIALLPGIVSSETWVAYSYYPGYPGYPGWGWGGCCWGGYYPYPPTTVYSYQSGTLVVSLVQFSDIPENPTEEDLVKIRWNAAHNGLAEGDAASIRTRLRTMIDQGFAQSPYVKAGR